MRRVHLIKPRPVTVVTNDTYFEYNNGLILNKAVLFEDLGNVNAAGFEFSFPNLRVAYFRNCDKNYIWDNLEPERMPNVRHICLATPYDGEIVYRFPRKTNVLYHISSKHFKSSCEKRDNIVLWNHDTLISFIESMPKQKLQVLTTDRMCRD